MAYTYDNFVSAANAAGMMNKFSEQDLQTAKRNPEFGLSMLSLMQDSSNAKSAEQKLLANETANQLRKSYGVYNTGTLGTDGAYAGSYGSQIQGLLDQIGNYGSFDYENREQYRQLLDSVANPQPFRYDLQEDPSWGAYRKMYLREGDRASANALAQAASASGGRTSSYAQTAAQQAGNYYAGQLSDIIPALEQNAYSRYLNDLNSRLSGLGALEADRAFEYQNYLDQLGQLQDKLANYQGQDALNYQRYLDAYNRAYQERQAQLAQEQQAYENALALYQTLGHGTEEADKVLGIGSGSTAGAAGDAGNTAGSGTAAGGGSGYNNGSLTAEQVRQLQVALGVDADGKYGSMSRSAAGGLGPEEAYAKYVAGAGSGTPVGGGALPQNMVSALKSSYPDGTVSNRTYWDSLVAIYGEAVLNAAGFRFGQTQSSAPREEQSAVDNTIVNGKGNLNKTLHTR